MNAEHDGRMEAILHLLTRLGTGELGARGEPSRAGDDLDAVTVGINMLAEELEASRFDLEERVAQRTSELEAVNCDIAEVTELGNLLQACGTLDEAYEVISTTVASIFGQLSGAVYLFSASRNLLEARVTWGSAHMQQFCTREECWALRRGQRHLVSGPATRLCCGHLKSHTGDSLCVPMAAQGETVGMLVLMECGLLAGERPGRLTEAKQRLAVIVAEQTAVSIANIGLRDALRHQALRDPLTGLYNRRFVEEWSAQEISRAARLGTSLGLISADVDHFKLINDVHGHEAGDAVLVRVADVLRRSLRAGDVACRFGGEEFLILLTDVTLAALVARAEQLVANVAAAHLEHGAAKLPPVTISAGVALYPQHGRHFSDVVKAADSALYSAKRSGRNRVIAAQSVDATDPGAH